MPIVTSKKVLIVTPTYNEEENIIPLANKIFQENNDFHLLFVDDNSPDQTQKMIEKLQKERPKQVHLIRRKGKMGLGSAYVEGFSWGLKKNYEYLVEMDADLSHNPEHLPEFMKALDTHHFVVGSRYVPGGGTVNWGLSRRLLSQMGSLYSRTILNLSMKDLTGGYNAWHRDVLEAIDLSKVKSEGYSFQIELKYKALRAGFTGVEVPITFHERRSGSSKISKSIILEAIFQVWRLKLGL